MNNTLQNLSLLKDQSLLFGYIHDVIDFAIANINALHAHCPYWTQPYSKGVEWVDKILAETALLGLITKRVEVYDSVLQEKLEKLSAVVAPLVRSTSYLQKIMRNPQMVTVYGMGHIALTAAGNSDTYFDYVVKQAIGTRLYEASEKIPFRNLDTMWLLSLYDQANYKVCFDKVAACSILNSNSNAFFFNRSDAYAVTHTMFYLTDFGRVSLPPCLDTKYVGRMIDEIICWNILSADLDLLGEILICALLLGEKISSYALIGLEYFFRTWQHFTILFGPSFDPKYFQTLEGAEARAYTFQNTYHTYYIGGILCACLLEKQPSSLGSQRFDFQEYCFTADRQNCYPLSEIKFKSLQQLIQEKFENNIFLLPALDSVQSTSEDAINFMLDVLLIFAVREYDLKLIDKIYNIIIEYAVPPTALTRASLHYLNMQQLPDGLVGVFSINNSTPEVKVVSNWLNLFINKMTAYCSYFSDKQKAI